MGVKTYMWISGKINLPMRLFYTFSKKTGLGSQNKKIIQLLEKPGGYTIESKSTFIGPGMYGKYIHIKLNTLRYMQTDNAVFELPEGYRKASYGK
jgi:hypothetical protein